MRHFLALLLFLSPQLLAEPSEKILVAVASNFAAPMQDIARQFEQETGHTVNLSYGASGKFYAQIIHGAPFDVFFSADTVKPDALEQGGQSVPNSRFTYAIGRLVLWSRDPEVIQGFDILKTDEFNKLALANPRLAPYGLAAQQTLAALGLKELTQPKWVVGENIAQTYQFVSTGNAELGFVAKSQVVDNLSDHVFENEQMLSGSGWLVPSDMHRPIRQDAVILNRAANRKVVSEFVSYVRSAAGAAVIKGYGYEVPD